MHSMHSQLTHPLLAPAQYNMASLMKSLEDSVEIYFDKTLGIGTYGQVCSAKYGQLLCAAKVLHNTFFQFSGESGTRDYTSKFEQECEFLGTMKHPNIVQHLGTFKEPQSGRPMLLMELLDESLTVHLGRQAGPIPYHHQLDIGHDVALALSYLHSNGIVHRDLSSNNVLLNRGGTRAKVTDFGLYKLIDSNPCVSPLAHAQGTLAYMAPEVLLIPPKHSTAMDCFSLGVLLVQLITRNFPNPGDAHRSIEDAGATTGSGHIVVQIPELERRKDDINLVESGHPLLSIILLCLNDRYAERPSSDDLCEKLALLKTDNAYSASQEEIGDEVSCIANFKEEIERKEQVIHDYQAKLDEQKQVIEKLKGQLEAFQKFVEEYRVQEANTNQTKNEDCTNKQQSIQTQSQEHDMTTKEQTNDISMEEYSSKEKADESTTDKVNVTIPVSPSVDTIEQNDDADGKLPAEQVEQIQESPTDKTAEGPTDESESSKQELTINSEFDRSCETIEQETTTEMSQNVPESLKEPQVSFN